MEHMVQAAPLAEEQGFDQEVVLAALLHDIGHICEEGHGDNEMGTFGIKDHESIGAQFLSKRGFSRRLTRLVESHVEAREVSDV